MTHFAKPRALCILRSTIFEFYNRCYCHQTSAHSIAKSDVSGNKIDKSFNFDNKVSNIENFYSKYQHVLQPLINELTKFGVSEFEILKFMQNNLKILDYDANMAAISLDALRHHGFRDEFILNIIGKYPKILTYHYNEIRETLEAWKSCSIEERFLLHFLSQNPELFELDNDIVKKRLRLLIYHMGSRLGRVTKLLVNNPQVLYADWDLTEYKLNYLFIKMKVTEKQIAESKALSLPLSHIKLRHTFLEKAGIYKTPDPKHKNRHESEKNPSLTRIVDTNDNHFAFHVAGLSLDEYETFKNIIKYVKEEPESFDDENDSESSEELSDYDNPEEDDDNDYTEYVKKTLDY